MNLHTGKGNNILKYSVKRRFLKLLSFVFISTIILCNISLESFADTPTPPQDSWPTYPNIYAEAGVLIEASTGTVLYDSNAHNQMYPASITKILTTLLALEKGNLSDMVEYSHYDVFSLQLGDAHIARKEGELLSLKDSLYAVMLASANEAANAVGEYVGKKSPQYTEKIESLKASGEEFDESKVAIQVFADMMNERAKQAGALNTHFTNPNGLFDENHYTTPYDMAMIMRDAVKNDEFLKIESNLTYTIPTTNMNSDTQPIANRHKMMFPNNPVYYEGIVGGKTGYVDQSGSTLVTCAKRNGMTLISVVMKSNGANVYNDTKLLLDYGFNNFSLLNVADNETKFTFDKEGKYESLSAVFNSDTPLIQLNPNGNVILPNGVTFDQCKSELKFLDQSEQTSEDTEGTPSIARLNYYYNNINVGGTTLTINKDTNESFNFGPTKNDTSSKSNKNNEYIKINIWFLLILLALIVVGLLIFYYTRSARVLRISRRRRLKKRNSNHKRNLR